MTFEEQLLNYKPFDVGRARQFFTEKQIKNPYEGGGAFSQLESLQRDIQTYQQDIQTEQARGKTNVEGQRLLTEAIGQANKLKGIISQQEGRYSPGLTSYLTQAPQVQLASAGQAPAQTEFQGLALQSYNDLVNKYGFAPETAREQVNAALARGQYSNAPIGQTQTQPTALSNMLPVVQGSQSVEAITNEPVDFTGFFGASNSGAQLSGILNASTGTINGALLNLFNQQQQSANQQLQAAQTRENTLLQGYTNVAQTSSANQLTQALEQYKVQEKMTALTNIKEQILKKQQALNLGIQQEQDRIAPISIIGRRQQKLKDQTAGELATLAISAQVIQDDLNFAQNLAELSFNALQNDKENQLDSYKFLLGLERDKIVQLKSDEKSALNNQINLIQNEITRAEADKDKVLQMIFSNPEAAVKGNVSLTDTPESVVSKMLPHIQASDDKKLVIDLASKYPDANINLTDSVAVAQSKVPNSRIYQQATRLAGGGGVVGTSPISPVISEIPTFEDFIAQKQNEVGEITNPEQYRQEYNNIIQQIPEIPSTISEIVKGINEGRFTAATALTNIKDGDLKLQLLSALSQSPSPVDNSAQLIAKQKIDLIDKIESSPGLSGAVGPNRFARFRPIASLTGSTSDFIASVQQLTSQETMNALLNLKKAGGTLGALSEGEREMLVNASSKIGFWALKDKSGKVYAYNTSQTAFKKELETLKELTNRAITNSYIPTQRMMPDGTQWVQNADGSFTQVF